MGLMRTYPTSLGFDEDGLEIIVHLDPKQKLMAQYIADGNNNTQSRLLAGYQDVAFGKEGEELQKGKRMNSEYASRMIAKYPAIMQYANYLRTLRHQKLSLKVDDLLKTSAAIIQFDVARMFTSAGEALPVQEMDPATRAAIKKMKVTQKEDYTVYEYEFYDKIQAINMLAKLTDLAGDKLKTKLTDKKVTMQRFTDEPS